MATNVKTKYRHARTELMGWKHSFHLFVVLYLTVLKNCFYYGSYYKNAFVHGLTMLTFKTFLLFEDCFDIRELTSKYILRGCDDNDEIPSCWLIMWFWLNNYYVFTRPLTTFSYFHSYQTFIYYYICSVCPPPPLCLLLLSWSYCNLLLLPPPR